MVLFHNLNELFRFVNAYLRHILRNSKKYFHGLTGKELDVIQDLFQSSKFYTCPNAEQFVEQLTIIAHELLIEKSNRALNKSKERVCPEK